MRCLNPVCDRLVARRKRFCAYCGTPLHNGWAWGALLCALLAGVPALHLGAGLAAVLGGLLGWHRAGTACGRGRWIAGAAVVMGGVMALVVVVPLGVSGIEGRKQAQEARRQLEGARQQAEQRLAETGVAPATPAAASMGPVRQPLEWRFVSAKDQAGYGGISSAAPGTVQGSTRFPLALDPKGTTNGLAYAHLPGQAKAGEEIHAQITVAVQSEVQIAIGVYDGDPSNSATLEEHANFSKVVRVPPGKHTIELSTTVKQDGEVWVTVGATLAGPASTKGTLDVPFLRLAPPAVAEPAAGKATELPPKEAVRQQAEAAQQTEATLQQAAARRRDEEVRQQEEQRRQEEERPQAEAVRQEVERLRLAEQHRPHAEARERALQAQKMLHALGFYRGAIDGRLGPQTRDALRQYQAEHSLLSTGGLDEATWKALQEQQRLLAERQEGASAGAGGAGSAVGTRPLSWTFAEPLPSLGGKTLTAYSLQVAEAKVQHAKQQRTDFRQSMPEVWYLGGITTPWAFVVDGQTGDLILVGERGAKGVLTLDDLVVALRSPQASGCVVSEPPHSPEWPRLAEVRFFGGIENTRVGQVCLDAHRLLERLALGLEQPRMAGFRSYADLMVESVRDGAGQLPEGRVRFWLAPAKASLHVWQKHVVLTELRMHGFYEAMAPEADGKPVQALNPYAHPLAQNFAQTLSDSYAALAQAYEAFTTWESLSRLQALTRGVDQAEVRPALRYWLERYRTAVVDTPRRVPALRAEHEVAGRRMEIRLW